MHVIHVNNVNDAYREGLDLIRHHGNREPSRAGDVLVVNQPVTTVYERPMQRVLFDEQRDANPFFHLMEAAWMLAGRRDATWLDRFVSDFSKRFAEDDGNAHGAYGYRWRKHFLGDALRIDDGADDEVGTYEFQAVDQVMKVGEILFDNPTTRQAVIGMWDPSSDLGAVKRDIPCNDMIMFRGRPDNFTGKIVLDMTVLCRSNDVVWGAYGANVVHMSILQELIAGLAGLEIGRYYQVSNNFHLYTSLLDKIDLYRPANGVGYAHTSPFPMIPEKIFDRQERRNYAIRLLAECEAFIENPEAKYEAEWLVKIVQPMYQAHQAWRNGHRNDAVQIMKRMVSCDWSLAGLLWMERRLRKLEMKEVRES